MAMNGAARVEAGRIPAVVGAWILLVALANPLAAQEFHPIFDGKTLEGWEGDTAGTWRVEEGAITAGSLDKNVPRNEFLCTRREYGDFELRLQYKLEGVEGFVNGGVQIRSQRIPNNHEMIGYQADIGAGFDGALYDESRRNKVLAAPDKDAIAKIVKRDGWNDYRIRCQGPRIQLWLNGEPTVDYTEPDPNIPQKGFIAVQIHGDGKTIIRFKDLKLAELAR